MVDCRPCAMPLERLKRSKGGRNELPEHRWQAALPGSQMVGHLIRRQVCEHFSDADMAGDIDGRKSTSGVLAFLGSVPCRVAVAEAEGGGAVDLRGRVHCSGHSSVPRSVAMPTTGRAHRGRSSPPTLMVENKPAIALQVIVSIEDNLSSSSSRPANSSWTSSPNHSCAFGSWS
jgi:hypothetical protein